MTQDCDERRLRRTPCGAFTERDGPLVRHHLDTHVTIQRADDPHCSGAPYDLRFGSFGQHHEDSLLPRLRTGGKKK